VIVSAGTSALGVAAAKRVELKGVGVGVTLGKGIGVAVSGASATASTGSVGVSAERSSRTIVGVGVTLPGVQEASMGKISQIRVVQSFICILMEGWKVGRLEILPAFHSSSLPALQVLLIS
jgi:hypothetical protein